MKRRRLSIQYLLPILLVALICGFLLLSDDATANRVIVELYDAAGIAMPREAPENELTVHFIDVGQGDCVLIRTPEQNILIDAGDADHTETVANYLRAQEVKQLDLVIASHPHADHIGGMTKVLQVCEVRKILFAPLPNGMTPTSRSYEKLLDTLALKKLSISLAKPGNRYDLGGGASLTLLGSVLRDPEDLNDTSIVCRLDYGDVSFLFCGDLEERGENALLQASADGELQADVLKLGHHGSETSTQSKWLRAVQPSIAIASCGLENPYGHPHAKVLRRLSEFDVQTFRTDRDGTVIVGTDGTDFHVWRAKD